MELDDFDRRLLDAVQEDNRRTGEELAALVGLSPAACLRRLQRLRAGGAIEREVAILNPKVAGPRLSMVVLVTLEREGPDQLDRFAREMRAAPEVTQCYYVTGAVDFVLMVGVADMAAYEDFTRRHLFGGNVRRFETMAVMGRMKFATAVPLAAARG
jgi:Lrp/AsnC family transcriptional regulator, leucine-responsive regulatory protein